PAAAARSAYRSDHILVVPPADAPPPVRGRMTRPDPRPRRARPDAAIALMREPAPFELWHTDAEAGRHGENIQRGPVAEHNGHTQGRPPGLRQIAGEEFVLPAACDIDRETLAEVSVGLGLGTVHGMAIDRRRT